jgi:hypothetical protein
VSDLNTTTQDHQLAQALQAAIGPRVHFDSDQVHALCVVPKVTDPTGTPPIIHVTDSDDDDIEIMEEKADDAPPIILVTDSDADDAEIMEEKADNSNDPIATDPDESPGMFACSIIAFAVARRVYTACSAAPLLKCSLMAATTWRT